MMAYASGRPSRPARADDGALPPVAIQIGSWPCTGRGTTSSCGSDGRAVPVQVTFSVALVFSVSSRSSFCA